MTEFGIILWPDAIVDLIRIHNPSYIPLDAKVVGFRLNAMDSTIEIDFMTEEDVGKGTIPVKHSGPWLKVN